MTDAGLAYAREVYAACATVGYDEEDARRLKAMIDRVEITDVDIAELVALAQQVQLASIKWLRATR